MTGNVGEASGVPVAPCLALVKQDGLDIKKVHNPLFLFGRQVGQIGANSGNEGAAFVGVVAYGADQGIDHCPRLTTHEGV